METRNVKLTLDKAREWYNSCNVSLKEVALQAFTEEELKEQLFKDIKTFEDACYAMMLNPCTENNLIKHIKEVSKASAAAYKLNIVRKALNKGQKMDFKKGTIWFPYNPTILSGSFYYKGNNEIEVAKVRIGCDTFTLLGGCANAGASAGLGGFYSDLGVASSAAGVGFLGCATQEIAQHFGKYFAKEIFEAKYGDIVDFKWEYCKQSQ